MAAERDPSARHASRAPARPRGNRRPAKARAPSKGNGQARRALPVDEQGLRLLIEQVKDYAIILLDPRGRILSWNRGAEIIKGYRAEEIVGQSMSRFYTKDDVKRGHPAQLLKAAAKEGRTEEEGWRVRKDGGLFWADVVITALRDDGGRLCGFAKVTRDLTARRGAEEALRESRERLRAILEHSPSMIFLKDLEGRYLDCNPSFEALCGRGRGAIIGRSDADLFTAAQAAQFVANDRQVIVAGAPMRFEETAIHPDGPRVSIVSKFPLRDAEGRVYAVGGIVTDITDQKRAEESLRLLSARLIRVQDDEQERVARELQRGIVEGLDNLHAQLALVKDSRTLFDWKTAEALDRSMGLAREVSREVRTLARLLYPSLLDDAGLVEALSGYAGSFSHRTGIKVVLDASPRLRRLSRDAERSLFRVVQESLNNVQRHSGSQTVAIRLKEDAYAIRLEVEDSGRGIAPGILDGSSATAANAGIGIRGMQERMRQLGGRLEIDSGNQGTTVRAILPASGSRRGDRP